MTVYTGILGSNNAQLGNFVLGGVDEALNDIVVSPSLSNPETVLTFKGEEWVTNQLAGINPDLYIGWGTGTGELSKENLELFEEDPETDRRLATISTEEIWPKDGSGMTKIYTASAKILAAKNISITEVGLFDAATNGNLLIHRTFEATSLEGTTPIMTGDSVIFNFTLNPS